MTDTTQFPISEQARRIERAVVEAEIARRRPRPSVVFVWPSSYDRRSKP